METKNNGKNKDDKTSKDLQKNEGRRLLIFIILLSIFAVVYVLNTNDQEGLRYLMNMFQQRYKNKKQGNGNKKWVKKHQEKNN